MKEALNAQKWLYCRNRPEMGPIRGIDSVIARAVVDANISAESPYGQFLRNVLHACTDDMAMHLPL
eukprot:8521547-Heterocapsa_arctica.AAC.1